MTDVFTLLSFPESNAFSAYRSPRLEVDTTESHSPPRKTPRLDSDLDSASASRSRGNPVVKQESGTNDKAGPITITITGVPSECSRGCAIKWRLRSLLMISPTSSGSDLRSRLCSCQAEHPVALDQRKQGQTSWHIRENIQCLQKCGLFCKEGGRIVRKLEGGGGEMYP